MTSILINQSYHSAQKTHSDLKKLSAIPQEELKVYPRLLRRNLQLSKSSATKTYLLSKIPRLQSNDKQTPAS